MKRPGRVLIVDDREVWREELSEALAETDYEIETAGTRAEAEALFASKIFHVLVLDVRLEDEDVHNEDGMDWLRELGAAGRGNAYRVIMCSGWGVQHWSREAFAKYRVEDFLDKGSFKDEELIDVVDRCFNEKLQINLMLDIHWKNRVSAESAVKNLLVGEERVRAETPRAKLLAEELEDLLCRLFHTARSVLLEPLTSGLSGAGILLARPCYDEGSGRSVVVKFGDPDLIEREHRQFETLVRPFVGGGRSTSVLGLRRTPRLGGILYSFMGTGGDRLADFGELYRRSDPEGVAGVIDELFGETCSSWYSNLGQVEPLDLTRFYREMLGLEVERLESAIRDYLKGVQGTKTLTFNRLREKLTIPNPIESLETESWTLPTYSCLTHGDLNPQNILIDDDGHCWLIDFQRTGKGHVLRDLIQLDCAVRLELLGAKEVDLDRRLALERALLKIDGFPPFQEEPPVSGLDDEVLEKAYRTCAHLRAWAGHLLANHPAASVREFYVGASYFGLNFLRFYRAPTVCREHALLSAGLLQQALVS